MNNGRAFQDYVSRQAERMRRSRSSRGRFWGGMALVGSLGWIVALPMVAGAMAGRWLDERLGTNLSFTLGFLLLGLFVGGYSVWRLFLRDIT